ncbi:Uncharacterized protein Adt_07994 [Abeliophyllum distichum]|uniref:Pollen Ole e 1 allergen and extensin family protein n=1 Tax=Abeliophyllum distichum TaxID=126358 RepID=A0ABD1VBC5_9LAMI
MATSITETHLGICNPISVTITGNVQCCINSIVGVNVTATPFPNATVQLICLQQNVLANTTTSSNGAFTLTLINGSPTQLATLPTCQVLVVTPLTSYNATLPGNGRLLSMGLQLAGVNVAGTSLNILFNVLGFILNIGINEYIRLDWPTP